MLSSIQRSSATNLRRGAAPLALAIALLSLAGRADVAVPPAPPPTISPAYAAETTRLILASVPGASPARLRADFAPFQALLLVYMDSWSHAIRTILSLVPRGVESILLADAEEAKAIPAWLEEAGVDTGAVTVAEVDLDSPWVRDYAPLEVIGLDDSVRWVDAMYDPSRPKDDALPRVLGEHFPVSLRKLDFPLDGGALISNGRGLCASTREAIADSGFDLSNPGRRDALLEELGCDVLALLPALSEEPTRHADVLAQFLDERTVAVGSMSPGPSPVDARLLDEATSLLREAAAAIGQPLEVVRVPIERGEEDVYYTWINGLRMDDVFVVPQYDGATQQIEDRAHRALADAMPGVTLVPVAADAMIEMDGAIHCITAQLHRRPLRRIAVRPGGIAVIAARQPSPPETSAESSRAQHTASEGSP